MEILVIQNRMGIGDMVIYIPFIEAISKKFNVPISILVKENTKASILLNNNKHIKKIIILDRDNENGSHNGFAGSLRLVNELKKYKFDKVFIFNSSLRFNLICKLSGIKKIYQYPLFKIKLEKSLVQDFKMKYKINNNQKNIILGIGGSGPTKRVPAEKFIIFMHMALEKYDCRFFLATGSSEQEQFILNEILSTDLKEKCVALDKKNIDEIMPIIKNCQIAICNDSSFSHLSAALEIPTIVLMSDTPLLYGSYSPKMYPIIPDGETEVRHGTLGKDKINPEKIYSKFNEILD